MEAVAHEDIRPAVAVVIDPRDRRAVVASFLGQQMRVVTEIPAAQVRIKPRTGRRGQQQIGQSVSVVVRPHCGTAAGQVARDRDLVQRLPAVLQQSNFRRPDETKVDLAIAVEVNRRDSLCVGINPRKCGVVRESRQTIETAEIVAAEAHEITLFVVIIQLQARAQPLNFGAPKMQVILVAIDHARYDHFLASENVGDGIAELVDVAGKGAKQERLTVAHVPPFAARVALVPVGPNARLAGAAVVEHDSKLARLSPVHRVLPLARMETRLGDVVLDDIGRVLALDVAHLGIDDEVLFLVNLVHLDEDDVGRQVDDLAEAVRGFNVSEGERGRKDGETEQSDEMAGGSNAHRVSFLDGSLESSLHAIFIPLV